MKHSFLCVLLISLAGIQPLLAREGKITAIDTIKTYALNEVVITSSVKETNATRTLPGAISVFSPRMVANRQISALKGLSSFVPNLYIPDYGSKMTSAIYIRGIGARSSGQSVGLYVDNMPYMNKSTFDFEWTDIQRVEVLRGPQGTLYGRNAMGGIINIYTLSPLQYQGTKLSASGGSYGQANAKVSHYHKLNPNLGFSIGGYYDRSDGFFVNNYTGDKADWEESAGGRVKIDWRIRPNLTAALATGIDYTDQGAFPYGKYDSSTGKVMPVNYNDPGSFRRTVWNNNLSFEYKTNRFALTSTTGYQYFNDDMKMDQDYDTLSIFVLNQKQKQKAFNEEIAIKSNTTDNYQWSLGLYGFYDDLQTEGPVTFKEDGIQRIFQSVFDSLKQARPAMPTLKVLDETLPIPATFATPSYGLALFHQSTYNNLFVPGLSLTAGFRLDYEKQEMTYRSSAKMHLGMSMFPNMPITDISSMYETSVINQHLAQDFLQLLPKIALKYECTPRTMTYLSVAKGYKAGGYNIQMSADVMQTQMQYDVMSTFQSMMPDIVIQHPPKLEDVAAYKPEQSWNYELGIRTELISNSLQAELTTYYMDIKDIQLTQFVQSGSGRILTNAGKASSYGIEASLRASLATEWSADLNYGYTHASFCNYNDGMADYSGKYVPYAPRHTLGAGVQYATLFQHSWINQLTGAVQFTGAGKIYWTEKNDIEQPFYGVLNAKIGIRKGIVSLSLWGRNLTNTSYTAFYFDTSKYDGTKDRQAYMQLGKPLQIGAEVVVHF